MGQQPGPARAGLSGAPGTAPNPCLLWQEQIKGPQGTGRRGPTLAVTDQSPRWLFVPGEEANPSPLAGATTLSEAPPTSTPHPPSSLPSVTRTGSPSTRAWRRSHQPRWLHPCLCFSFPPPSLPPGRDSSQRAPRWQCRQWDTRGSVPSTTRWAPWKRKSSPGSISRAGITNLPGQIPPWSLAKRIVPPRSHLVLN